MDVEKRHTSKIYVWISPSHLLLSPSKTMLHNMTLPLALPSGQSWNGLNRQWGLWTRDGVDTQFTALLIAIITVLQRSLIKALEAESTCLGDMPSHLSRFILAESRSHPVFSSGAITLYFSNINIKKMRKCNFWWGKLFIAFSQIVHVFFPSCNRCLMCLLEKEA